MRGRGTLSRLVTQLKAGAGQLATRLKPATRALLSVVGSALSVMSDGLQTGASASKRLGLLLLGGIKRLLIWLLITIDRSYEGARWAIGAFKGGVWALITGTRRFLLREWRDTKAFLWYVTVRVYRVLARLLAGPRRLLRRFVDGLLWVYFGLKGTLRRTYEAASENPEFDAGQRVDRFVFGVFGRLWRDKDRFDGYAKQVKMARFNEGYEVYLSRSLFYSLSAGVIGAAMGLVGSLVLAPTLIEYDYNVTLPVALAQFLQNNAIPLVVTGGLVVSGTLIFLLTAASFYYRPIYIAGERGRAIDKTLPHAITFMYALSRGGMNVLEVVRELSTASDTYGETAEEFAAIRRKVDRTNTDLNTAVMEVAYNTPSESLEDFLEDFRSIIDSGSNPEDFFYDKSESYLDVAREQQENTLQTLEIFSEMYVILFVVSPIFVLIIQMVIGILGDVDELVLSIIPVGVLIGAVLFTGIIYLLSSGSSMSEFELEQPTDNGVQRYDEQKAMNDDRATAFKWGTRYERYIGNVLAPLSFMRDNPLASLGVTVPLAGAFVGYAAVSGLVGTELAVFNENHIWATFVYIYIPLVITLLPLSLLHEVKTRREKNIVRRLHELFNQAAQANERGLTLEESVRVATESSSDALATELEKATNRASWTGDLNGALVEFANRMRVPRLSRTIRLITKANDSSGDVRAVLTVAAEDLKAMHKLDKERIQNALQHTIIIGISFVIGVGVIAMLDISFLSVFENQLAHSEASGGAAGVEQAGFGRGIDINVFRRVFLQTTMALGLGSGIVAGTMATNDPLKGIKYSLVMMTIPLVVFTFA